MSRDGGGTSSIVRVSTPALFAIFCASYRKVPGGTGSSTKLVGHVVGSKGVAVQSSTTRWLSPTFASDPTSGKLGSRREERWVGKEIEGSGTTTILVRVSGTWISTTRIGKEGGVGSSIPQD